MTVELSGLAGIQSRIAEIQSRAAMLTGASVIPQAPAAASASFDSALAQATAAKAGSAGTGTATAGTSATTPTSVAEAIGALKNAAGTTGGSGAPVRAASAQALIAAAQKYLGVPYRWGGTDPATGLDCSGFVQRAFDDIGMSLPRVAADQAKVGRPVESMAQAKPGDLIAFGSPVDHIGIYVGDGKMIVAPKTGDVVKIQTVYRTPTAIRRILPDQDTTGTSWGASLQGVQAAAAQALQLGSAAAVDRLSSSVVPGSALAQAPSAYRQLFLAAEDKYGVPASLLAAVAKAESGFTPNAVSPVGARGMMQFMPATAAGLGINPNDPAQAVDGAARLLRSHLRRFGSTELALAAYNAGPGAVQRYGGVPPYAETRGYVRRIMADSGVLAA